MIVTWQPDTAEPSRLLLVVVQDVSNPVDAARMLFR